MSFWEPIDQIAAELVSISPASWTVKAVWVGIMLTIRRTLRLGVWR